MRAALDERGTATLELAIVAPVLMLLILGVLQFGLWYHAQHVVQTAAVEAARSAAAKDAVDGDAEALGSEVVRAGLGSMASSPIVDIQVGPDAVSARVTASMKGLLPLPGLGSLSLNSTAISYRERFRPSQGGP